MLGAVTGIAGCSVGGTQSGQGSGAAQDGGCTGFCANANTFLTAADVDLIMAQAIQEAQARGVSNATFAVVDRTGFVLDARRLGGASQITVTSNRTSPVQAPFSRASLEGLVITDNGTVNGAVAVANVNASGLAAVSKAITAAYLSSEGNAFTTRTASQIVQENFNPGEIGRAGGPLFGVQFSQLACSDIAVISNDPDNPGVVKPATNIDGAIAPHVSPLGLSADPGGLPLYKGGTPVGGIGVISDQIYSLDRNISDFDTGVAANDEAIALAATFGFAAPIDRLANRITVDGKLLRFTDVDPDLIALQSFPANAAGNQAALLAAAGRVSVGVQVAATAFFNDAVGPHTGAAFGVPAAQNVGGGRFSGIVPAAAVNAFTGQAEFAARDAFVLTNAAGNTNAYLPRDGTAPAGSVLTVAEVVQILSSALDVANAARAQIRRPVGSQMRATISVVDAEGRILGIVRTRDAPLFGTDVSLQKARTAALFSRADAGAQLTAGMTGQSDPTNPTAFTNLTDGTFGTRVTLAQTGAAAGVADPHQAIGGAALTDGTAFSDRAGGNLSRPFYPDGVGEIPGPFSNPFARWSPFATGLQLELVFEEITRGLFGAGPSAAGAIGDIQTGCSTLHQIAGLQNGIQIFPGSVPIYRGNTLIGGVGVSGDGIDQDDMVSFLGLHNASVLLGGAIGNAPTNIRADQLVVGGVNLRYVQCPQGPFLNSTAQNVCQGK
ncbi:MAG: hypothetical protein GKR94_30350 [Gammaproteobacteria bacterium]|nr:hypothetical protein [Gammaproteobacteria bacterium]